MSLPPFLLDVRDAQSSQAWITTSADTSSSSSSSSWPATGRWLRAYFHPHTRTLGVPPNVLLPATIDVQKDAEKSEASGAELDAVERLHIGDGAATERGGEGGGARQLRNVLHLSLFHRLTTLVLVGQRVDAPDLELPPRLQHLDLSGNAFRTIPVSVAALAHLVVLRMENNLLREVDAVTSLPVGGRLRELHLAYNPHLARVDLTPLGVELVYVDLQGADRKLELVNVATRPEHRAVFVDPSPHLRWVFGPAAGQGADAPNSGCAAASAGANSGCAAASAGANSGCAAASAGATALRKKIPPAAVADIVVRSRSEMDAFLLATNFARRLAAESANAGARKKYLADARALCAFCVFFPSLEAVADLRRQEDAYVHFTAFVRFCYYNDCYLDWPAVAGYVATSSSAITEEEHLAKICVASRYVIDLRRVFPLPNAMHASLAEVCDDDALFQRRMFEDFSDFLFLEIERVRVQRETEAREARLQTCRMLRDEAAAPGATRSHIQRLVACELEHG